MKKLQKILVFSLLVTFFTANILCCCKEALALTEKLTKSNAVAGHCHQTKADHQKKNCDCEKEIGNLISAIQSIDLKSEQNLSLTFFNDSQKTDVVLTSYLQNISPHTFPDQPIYIRQSVLRL